MAAESVALVAIDIVTSLASGLLKDVCCKAVNAVSESSTAAGLQSAIFGGPSRQQLHGLERELAKLDAVLSAAERMNLMQRDHNNLVLLWPGSVKDAAYLADNILDEISYNRVFQNRTTRIGRVLSGSDLAFRRRIAGRLERFMSMAARIYGEAAEIGIRIDELMGAGALRYPMIMSNDLRERRENVDTSIVIGRQLEQELIVRELCRLTDDRVLPVVGIVGISGVGKTTLARVVYDHRTVEEHFENRIWIFASENFTLERLLDEMLQSLTGIRHNLSNKGAMEDKLRGYLEHKRYLLVLDDIWNIDTQLWESVRASLLRVTRSTSSRVLVTTQRPNVASILGSYMTHQMEVLSDVDAWGLFEKTAFPNKTQEQLADVEDIAKRIMRKCGGLPLALKTLGSTLGSMKEIKEWEFVETSQLWNLPAGKAQIMPWLLLSFNHLPNARIKRCFAHCSVMMEKGSFIIETKLIQAWMAQGFIQKSEASSALSLEDIGRTDITTLVANGLLQTEFRLDGCYVMMHDLVHDLAVFVSKESCLIVKGANDLHDTAARAEHVRICGRNVLEFHFSFTKLRTLICIKSTIPLDFVAQARFLRHLQLVSCGLKEVPSSIGKLKHLRLLGLGGNPFQHLPKCIGTLFNLQVLDLLECERLAELPKQITKLINLRHIYTTLPVRIPKRMGQLANLRTLPPIRLNAKEGWKIKELGDLQLLRGAVEIYGLEHINCKQDALVARLKTKAGITDLELIWAKEQEEDDTVRNDEEIMDGLQPHANLKEIWVVNFGGKRFSSWLSDHYLNNLKQVFLFKCNRCEQLPTLGHLTNLESIEIDEMGSLQVVENDFFYRGGSHNRTTQRILFPKLKRLFLWNMPKLEDWNQPVGSTYVLFPCLEELEIKNCPLLVSAPTCIQSLKQLKIEGVNSELPLLKVLSTSSNLTALKIRNVHQLTRLSNTLLLNCTALQRLQISYCENLAELPPLQRFGSLETLVASHCDSLTYFPSIEGLLSLRDLIIVGCESLTNTPYGLESCVSIENLILSANFKFDQIPDFTRLRHLQLLDLTYFRGQTLIPECLSHLSNLWQLSIGAFKEELDEFSGLDNLPRGVRSLSLFGWPKLNSLPSELQLFGQLVLLSIYLFDGLETLPEWLGNLTSLQYLEINLCQKVKYLPPLDALQRLTHLMGLHIEDCPLMEERCIKGGSEWNKICSVPSVIINGVDIQNIVQVIMSIDDLKLALRSTVEMNKLNGTNLIDWERNLRIVLRFEGYEYVLSTPIPSITSTSTDEEKEEIEYLKADSVNVTSLMLAGMKPAFQKKFEHQDAYTIIKELRKMQERIDQYETHKTIIDSTLVKGKPVGPHVLDMIGLFSRMESLGAPYDPVLAADIVLRSLHAGFASFRMRFHIDGPKPSLNELHGMLVDAEKNMDLDNKKKVLDVNTGNGIVPTPKYLEEMKNGALSSNTSGTKK